MLRTNWFADGSLVRSGDFFSEGTFVSIVRIGLAETKNFAEGYDAIFGGKKKTAAKKGAKKSAKAATKKPKSKSMAKKKIRKK
jgi:hypothetical protein